MTRLRGHTVDTGASAGLFVSPGGRSTRHEEASPNIKKEPVEEESLPASEDEAREESNDEEDDDFVVDDDGVGYYQDEAFRIKQVSAPLIVNRTLRDLYGICENVLRLPLSR
jgi:hypothetical protein